MKPERLGDLNALACALVCGLGNIVVKVGMRDVSTELFNFYFFVFAFLISILTLINKPIRTEILSTNMKALGLIAGLTVFFTFGIYSFMSAIKIIEPATVSFLSRLEIIIAYVLAYFILKERLTLFELIGGAIAILGVFVLKFKTSMEISQASTLMIISAFFFAAAEVSVKKFLHIIGTMRFVFFRNLFAIGIFYIVLRVSGETLSVPNNETLFWAFIGALLLPILGRVTFIEALKRISISRAMIFTQTMPLITAIFALMFLGTIPTPVEWIGGVLILVGVMLAKLKGRKRKNVVQGMP